MNLKWQFVKKQKVLLAACGMAAMLLLGFLSFSAHSWHSAKGDSLLYGKVADTRDWIEGVGNHVPGVVKRAKVTINSLPPQTTYTDTQGQFWFKGLRDISYSIKVEVPYEGKKLYEFAAKVNGATGKFLDLIKDEEHNLRELDY
ncbi:MAG: carboxypeptidase-like regulatory domain-containing protein [Actinomycetota bacterium]